MIRTDKKTAESRRNQNKALHLLSTCIWNITSNSLKDYVRLGGDINLRHCGTTLLCKAADSGKLSEIKLMISMGADVNVCDIKKCTALHIAAKWGHPEVIQYLLKHGAKINARNVNDYTPLYSAIIEGRLECAKILAEAGADVNRASPIAEGSGHEILLNIALYTGILRYQVILLECLIYAGLKPHRVSLPLFVYRQRGLEQHLSVNLFKLLLRAGFVWDLNSMSLNQYVSACLVTDLKHDVKAITAIYNSYQPSLLSRTRTVIRNTLVDNSRAVHISKKIEELPLPQRIKRYLNLEE